jgi:protein gp37
MRTKNWQNPLRWNKKAYETGQRLRIFTCSMSDFFHQDADPWRDEAWDVIRECQNLDWLILTKRPELVLDRLPDDWGTGYANVWLGVTAGCNESIHRAEQLLDLPAQLKFISAEPLLEAIDFRPYLDGIDWIITGCEQAAKDRRRQMDLDWIRDIHGQCTDAGIPHFFKQYYHEERGVPRTDGLLDGVHCQEWPGLGLSVYEPGGPIAVLA